MEERPGGRIITFYSYKGGTGRSMVMANVAWILASSGKRVLVIDWDLEAPGLHRYFHPFLRDEDLAQSEGLIDFVVDFAAAALTPPDSRATGGSEQEWYARYANLLRYATSLDWSGFPSPGTLDFVPAGRQDAGYAARVNSFNWQHFYHKLGGGVFLETAKKRIREEYDYVLIDSRTGVGDTSGICTVQMPDVLVVCFLLNKQSIEGAAAVATSVLDQRSHKISGAGFRVWPIPMRVEMAEKRKLDSARAVVRARFDRFLQEMPIPRREEYWRAMEVLYVPFYAYEEVLAVFADRPGQTHSVLASVELLTGYLTEGAVNRMPSIPEQQRREVLLRYGSTVLPEEAIPLRCTVSTLPAVVRLEGRTELVADILLTFTAVRPAIPDGVSPVFHLQLYFSVNVTNRATLGSPTDVVLLSYAGPLDSFQTTHVRAVRAGGNSLLFRNVQFGWPSGTQTRSFRISGVRVSACQAAPLGAQFVGPSIQAFVTTVSSSPIPVENPTVMVGLVQPGLEFSVGGAGDDERAQFVCSRAEGVNQGLLDDPVACEGVVSLYLQFREAHPRAFRNRTEESGSEGLADTGTRFLARFQDVPSGVEIFVTTRNVLSRGEQPHASPPTAVLVPADPAGAGGEPAQSDLAQAARGRTEDGTPLSKLSVIGGHAYAVWEWVGPVRDPLSAVEQVSFGVVVAAKPDHSAVGTCVVSGALAPVHSGDVSDGPPPIPSFGDLARTVRAFSVV